MLKKIIVSIIITVFLIQIVGCYSSQPVMQDEALRSGEKILSADLKSGDKVIFNYKGGYFGNVNFITGIDANGSSFNYPSSSILKLYRNVPELIPLNSYIFHGNDYLVTNDNELFIYDKNIPVKDTAKKIIQGYSSDGKMIGIPFRVVKGFFKDIPNTISWYYYQPLDVSSIKCLVAISDNKVMHLVYPNNNGCKTYQLINALRGDSETGKREVINLNDIKSFYIKKFNIIYSISVIGVTVLLLYLIKTSLFNFELMWGFYDGLKLIY
jgi:hypothetical protein